MRSIVFAFFIGCLTSPAAAQEGADAATDPVASKAESTVPAVTVDKARVAEMQARVPVVGTLVARQEVQVNAKVSGTEITGIRVEEGDQVEKGEVLARLSRDTLAAQLAQAEAEYQQAEASYKQAATALERVQRLLNTNNAAQATLDDAIGAEATAKAALARADAARRITQLNLDRTEITAPVAGRIVERTATLGELTGSGPLFTLIADGEIEMSADVIETALQSLSVDQPAEIDVAGLGQVPGTVRLIPASVDPVTRLGKLRISLEATEGLRIGMFASGWVITAKRNAVTVPATAVLSDDQGDRVQLVRNGVVESQSVEAGLLWNGRREIVEGVEVGDQVIARSGAFFRDGDRVRVVDSSETETATASTAEPGNEARQP